MLNLPSLKLEIAGPAAMFARPDTGSTPISYPVPTYSAAKGIFEAIARMPSIYIRPTRVEICRPVRLERYVTNYGGPLRKSIQVKDGNNYQLSATVLVDVRFRLYAEIIEKRSTRGSARPALRPRRGRDRGAALGRFQNLFENRLMTGQSFYTPCLGWREFAPSYVGPFQPGTTPDKSINLVIPSLLHEMWEHKQVKPTFVQDWEIVNGVMSYQDRRPDDAQ